MSPTAQSGAIGLGYLGAWTFGVPGAIGGMILGALLGQWAGRLGEHAEREGVTMQTERIYIIFDSPPGDGPSNFVEVEDGDGNSLSPEQIGATWQKLGDQSWALGPFARVEPQPSAGVSTKRLHQGRTNPRRTGS